MKNKFDNKIYFKEGTNEGNYKAKKTEYENIFFI